MYFQAPISQVKSSQCVSQLRGIKIAKQRRRRQDFFLAVPFFPQISRRPFSSRRPSKHRLKLLNEPLRPSKSPPAQQKNVMKLDSCSAYTYKVVL